MDNVRLGQRDYEVKKAKLKVWLELGSIHNQIIRAVSTHNINLSSLISKYVETALSISIDPETPWEEVIDAFIETANVNAIDFKIPLLLVQPEDQKDVPWDYEGRNWYFWAHLLAREFGWSLDYIAGLEVEDAIKLMQEVLVTEQLNKEWEWALSEKSVSYNEALKKSEFKGLERPDWMKTYVIPPQPKQRKPIPVMLMPSGVIEHVKH